MQIISTNIGEKTAIKWRGKELFTGIYKYPVTKAIYLDRTDVKTDNVIDRKYHGGEDKACYLYSSSHYYGWKSNFPKLDWQWGMFGENITIEGFDESNIRIGDIFKLGTALVQITQPRQPCFKLGIRLGSAKAVKLFVEAERPGAYIRILKSGYVIKGDEMMLVEQKTENMTLKEVFHLIYNATENIERVKRAILMPELAESCKKDLIKYGKL